MPPTTLAAALDDVEARLKEAAIEDPRFESRVLVARAVGLSVGEVLFHSRRPISPAEASQIARYTEERSKRRPVSHIFGEKEFWSLTFEVTPDVLTPRPDTETLVEAALELIPDRDRTLSVLDLGVGSGCILISLLTELPQAYGVGVDIDFDACLVARRNAVRLGLDNRSAIIQGDWISAIGGKFDLVLSNPPYIPIGEIETLEPEVRDYEPRLALSGGRDGLDCYKRILTGVGTVIRPGGSLLLEVGSGQAPLVSAMARQNPLFRVKTTTDLGKVERCVLATVIDH